MQPYGINDKLKYNFKDCHPKNDEENWWEAEIGSVVKGRARRQGREEAKKQLKELEENIEI